MKHRVALLSAAGALSLLIAAPAHPQDRPAADPVDHAQHHPAAPATPPATPPAVPGAMGPMKSSAALDALVTKMNSAQGAAKVEAMAELLNALVQDRHACASMMTTMSGMMDKMKSIGGNMPMEKEKKN